MQNCPNCGAPWNPYNFRCEYCGTYAFDMTAWDIEEGTPCYVNFKTNQGTITTLARPRIETIEMNTESTDICDGLNNKIYSFASNRTCEINIKFECLRTPENKELFRIQKMRRAIY